MKKYMNYDNGYRKGLRKVAHLESEIDQLIESDSFLTKYVVR